MINDKKIEVEIVEYLYKKYYQENSIYSTATSSHWRKQGQFQSIEKTNNLFKLSGEGFGEFRKRKFLSIIATLPTKLFLMKMLSGCDNKILKAAKKISKLTNRTLSYDVARMAKTIEFINKNIKDKYEKIIIIGDGYGTLGSLFKEIYPQKTIIYINLGRTLAFDAYYSQCSFPNLEHKLISLKSDVLSSDFNYIEAENINELRIEADLFINIASMQEMNYDAINDYFKILYEQNKDILFYCCNRIEKTLPDGTVTKFFEYGWKKSDEIIVDELCPWHQKAPQIRPPFFYKFDGGTQHRLIKIKTHRKSHTDTEY
jgi:putative sugar O-methyltransferase